VSAISEVTSVGAEVKRALVVEDEIMVAMYVEDLLTDLGYEVAAIATGFEQALPLARDGSFDFAVLDINLAGRLSFPIADVLRERGIPFVFASGYGSRGSARITATPSAFRSRLSVATWPRRLRSSRISTTRTSFRQSPPRF
jgi:CheY-like chemotaxis protein